MDLKQFEGQTSPKEEHKIVHLCVPHPEEGNTDKWSCIQTDTFAYDLLFASGVSDDDIKRVTNLCAAAPELLSELSACRERVKELEEILKPLRKLYSEAMEDGPEPDRQGKDLMFEDFCRTQIKNVEYMRDAIDRQRENITQLESQVRSLWRR